MAVDNLVNKLHFLFLVKAKLNKSGFYKPKIWK